MDQPKTNRPRKTVLYVSLAAVIVIIILLLLRTCRKPGEPPFDYFLAKATELGHDPGRVGKFVRDEVATLSYHGDVKGPLGALWNGAASPEEKKRLLEALLKFCKGGSPPAIDDVQAQAPVCTLKITHRAKAETKIFEGPIGDCVGDVHSIEMPERGKTRVIVRARETVTKDIVTSGATFEELVFTVERPGKDPVTELRELWHAENRTGRRAAVVGDRHDWVVLPCRISPYVREKEELILKNRGRENAPEAKGYLALLDYARRSDLLLAKLEKNLDVRVQYDLPRILILSRFGQGDHDAYALDLRLDRSTFEGAASGAYLACEERSFLESGLEQHYLEEWSGLPSTSTFDLFSRLRDDYPNKSDRRLVLAAQALRTILETGGLDAKVTFRALGPGKGRKPLATVEVSRERSGGLRLRGGPVKADFAAKLAGTKDAPRIPYTGTGVDAPMASVDDAAVAVETTLMAADTKPLVPVDYVLEVQINRGQEPLVAPGAAFEFTWGSGENRTDQRIVVDECGGDLAFHWRVQTGVRPAVGQRTVAAQGLADSATHNPWYVMGPSRQEKATSFCVSRRVYEALKGGRACELTVEGRYPPSIEPDEKAPRPVEWKGTVSPAGQGTCHVKINGSEEDLSFIKTKIGETEVAILDDPSYPVGMADKLVSVSTSVRGKVVDENGLGIANAEIRFGGDTIATTASDGSFRLPPIAELFTVVRLKVLRGPVTLGEPEVDLSAPGRKEIVVKVDRQRTELVWINSDNAGDLKELKISAQVKRHAARDIEAGRLVVIPNRMIPVGATETIGYYALDPKTGDLRAVMEDGLCGASEELLIEMAQFSREQLKAGFQGKTAPFAYIHMLRGANVGFWVYCTYRLGGMENAEALQTMLTEMDAWDAATNMLSQFGKAAGKDAQKQLEKLLGNAGGGINGGDASRAFKIGYLGSIVFLGKMMEGE